MHSHKQTIKKGPAERQTQKKINEQNAFFMPGEQTLHVWVLKQKNVGLPDKLLQHDEIQEAERLKYLWKCWDMTREKQGKKGYILVTRTRMQCAVPILNTGWWQCLVLAAPILVLVLEKEKKNALASLDVCKNQSQSSWLALNPGCSNNAP